MQALTHAAKTGVLEGRIWGRLGEQCALVQTLNKAQRAVHDNSHHLHLDCAPCLPGFLSQLAWGALPAVTLWTTCYAPGDLGSIDAKYDIAVSSCTGMLDHIVVDSMPTAQVSCAVACDEALHCALPQLGADSTCCVAA
jgi:hypothetical protein